MTVLDRGVATRAAARLAFDELRREIDQRPGDLVSLSGAQTRIDHVGLGLIARISDCPTAAVLVIATLTEIRLTEDVERLRPDGNRSAAELAIVVGAEAALATHRPILAIAQEVVGVEKLERHHPPDRARSVDHRRRSARDIDAAQHFGLDVEGAVGVVA